MKMIWQSLRMLFWMTILTGLIYPILITLIGYFMFFDRSTGSLLTIDGNVRGSKLIAQKFTSDRYFWARPSAIDYNPLPSGGSNLGPISSKLKKQVEERRKKLSINSSNIDPLLIPADLLFASGSGLDPHITPEAAYFQVERIAKARSIPADAIRELIDLSIEKPTLRVMGRSRINVLILNQSLDAIKKVEEKHG